ncbi:MAG: hypothetical protein B6I37_01615 [Desulfobacteraceae bacterium 4572_35.2]|nr:MAG: hypothetical protein B6I37_01615 [Desulfobacteraceae bacterium 4572_35.2]
MIQRITSQFAAVLALTIVLALTGCGNVGPVQPLLKTLPKGADSITLEQKGNALLLSWQIPTLNQDGTALTNLAGFAIYKSDYDLAKGCPECRPPKNLYRKIDLAYFRSNNRNSNRIHLWDNAVEEEMGYRYKIIPYTAEGLDGASAIVHRPCFIPPDSPTNLVGTGLDHQARISWDAASETRQGVQLIGYNLYRRSGDTYFSTTAVNDAPLTSLNYEDSTVKNDVVYSYALRSVITIGEQQLESTFSTEVKVEPKRP